ncbi:MAG: hypothetical protein LBQ18_05420 [Campylobacteraceae bacterium]|jgi:hypothetical protein|nr:hypothetical protein [Campylobacteraceae bacterium]
MRKIIYIKTILAVFCSLFITTNVYAGTASKVNFDYDCNSLYIGLYNGLVDKATINPTTGAITAMNSIYTISGDSYLISATTIALGPYDNADGPLTMYHWGWNNIWNSLGAHIQYFQKNQTKRDAIYVATGTTSKPTNSQAEEFPPPRVVNSLRNYWSGGEVNQKSGELYLSSGEDDALDKDRSGSCGSPYCYFRMMIFHPKTKKYVKSSAMSPSTPSDYTPGYVASDMAIDAEGNAYILVSDSDGDKTSRVYWIIKVKPGKDGESWKYQRIKKITFPAKTSDLLEWWGMSFLNGKLYVGHANSQIIYMVDPLTGAVNEAYKYSKTIYDFASCQMAPAINGKVYYDKDGDGTISDEEKNANGIADVTVQVYSKDRGYLGEVLTSGNGEYSLILPQTKGTLYVRLKRPQINGVNAQQTWASGGRYEWRGGAYNHGNNTVTPQCRDGINKIDITPPHKGTYDGDIRETYATSCYGARADGRDLSSDNINGANYYTMIEMQTDRASIEANFALGPVDRSDAPNGAISKVNYNFKEASHSMAKGIYLGDNVSDDTASMMNNANADTDKHDDSVKVRQKDNQTASWEPLQNFTFTNKITYTFNVTIKETNANGYLNAWISLQDGKAANTATFDEKKKIADNINVSADKTCSGGICYVLFDYTVPNISSGIDAKNRSKAYSRFRYSSVNVNGMKPYDEPKDAAYWNNNPWVIDGEVEDYKFDYLYIKDPGLPAGDAIIVNERFNKGVGETLKSIDSDNPDLALYTQVAGEPFNVKFVYQVDKNVSKLATTDNNVSFTVDLVEVSDEFVGSYTLKDSCEALQVIEPNVKHGNINANTAAVFPLNGISTNNVSKKATFRVTFGYDEATQNKTSCSPDMFAIRPAKFEMGGINGNLVGGKEHNGKLKAVDKSGRTTESYNQTASHLSYKDANLTTPASCDTAQINTTIDDTNFWVKPVGFIKGTTDMSVQYNNVGNLNFALADSDWTQVDRTTRGDDCEANSSSNAHSSSKVGCDIASDQKAFKFIHDNFNATVTISNALGGNFTYLAYDKDMTADVTTSIIAKLANNDTATNYHQGCFAEDVEYKFRLDNGNFTGYGKRDEHPKRRIKFFEKDTTANITGNNDRRDGTGAFNIKEGNFAKGEAGVVKFGFNFGRNISKGENPFTASLSNFAVKDGDIHDKNVNKTLVAIQGSDITFFYGRAFIDNYEGKDPIAVKVRYELFCQGDCNKTAYALSFSDINIGTTSFYLNKEHNDANQGQIKSYTPVKAAMIRGVSAPANGIGNITLINCSTCSAPYADTIYAQPNNWLIYNPSNPTASDFSFTVKFIGTPGGWAGKGETRKDNTTGGVIEATPGNRTKLKMDW